MCVVYIICKQNFPKTEKINKKLPQFRLNLSTANKTGFPSVDILQTTNYKRSIKMISRINKVNYMQIRQKLKKN